MIRDLKWDSVFFGQKMGELVLPGIGAGNVADEIDKAKRKGYRHLICRLVSPSCSAINTLTNFGFVVTDIGVTWSTPVRRLLKKRAPSALRSVRIATEGDLTALNRFPLSLFRDSRFYHDPFFSKAEADRFFQAWIENCIAGRAADITLTIPGKAFVSCRTGDSSCASIVLIGVRPSHQAKGLGSALMAALARWCMKHRILTVSARTQISNHAGMNFYSHLGLSVESHDCTLSKIL